jgi:hypothetical protein
MKIKVIPMRITMKSVNLESNCPIKIIAKSMGKNTNAEPKSG